MKRRVLELVASSRGGAATHVLDLAVTLPRDRFEVEVVMPDDGGAITAADLTAAGVVCHSLELDRGVAVGLSPRLRRLIRGFDLVHAHGARAAFHTRVAVASLGMDFAGATPRPGERPSLGAQRPAVIHTVHGFAAPHRPQPRRALALAAERSLLRVTDRVVAVCEAERDAYLADVAAPARFDPARVVVVANGVDAARFDPSRAGREATRLALGIPGAALLVLTACRLDRPRDFATLLEAFSVLARHTPGAHLLIAGDGPRRADVERLAAALGVAGRVTLAGWRRDVPALLAASDVFALTSDGWEGLPLSVLEAMATGLPVVATDAGGVAEAVLDGETGVLVRPRDATRLAEALIRLADGDLRARLGRCAIERVATHFRLDQTTHRLADLYQSLLSSPRGRAVIARGGPR